MSNTGYPKGDLQVFFVLAGVALMVVTALILIFEPIKMQSIIGLILLFIIGLGLTVAGSPDSNKRS